MNDPNVWEKIFNKITEAIELLENFQGSGLTCNPSPETVEKTIELLQEIRLLVPGKERGRRQKGQGD